MPGRFDSERSLARQAKWRRRAGQCAGCSLFFLVCVACVLVRDRSKDVPRIRFRMQMLLLPMLPFLLTLLLTICVLRHQMLSVLLTTNENAVISMANVSTDGNATGVSTRMRKTVRKKMQRIVVTSACALGALLLAGHVLRRQSRWLRALHLPSSVTGGLLGWCFFAAVEAVGGGDLADDWLADGWEVLPGFCTNIIFSSLFLGTPVPRVGAILASPRREQFIYGLVVVFGQYVVSCLCTILCRLFDPSLDAPFATIMPYGYAGGPVVAEAMKDLYAEDSFNYPDGYTLALLAATVGMFAGVISGAVLVNFAPLTANTAAAADSAGARIEDPGEPPASPTTSRVGAPEPAAQSLAARGQVLVRLRRQAVQVRDALMQLKTTANDSDFYAPDTRPSAGEQTVSLESLDSFIFHVSLVTLVMLVGYVLRTPFVLAEELFPTGSFFERSNLLSVLPLFLFCLLASLGIQKVIDVRFTDPRTGRSFVDRNTMERISNSAQDVLIVVAISRLGRNGLPPGVHGLGHFFGIVINRGLPFILTCMAGVAWGVISFWYVAPRLLPDYWAERALIEFGVSIGATSTGLLLLRMGDPDGRTPVLRDFTFKQIFHVLITGGGVFDVMVPIPLCATTGSVWPLLLVCLAAICILVAIHPATPRRLRRLRGGQAESSTRTLRTLSVEAKDERVVPGPIARQAPPPAVAIEEPARRGNGLEVLSVAHDAL